MPSNEKFQETPDDKLAIARTIQIEPWPDPVTEASGHRVDSAYVETFWLPRLGPTCAWLIRRLAIGLDHHVDGYTTNTSEFAMELGIGPSLAAHSPFVRSLDRLANFNMLAITDETIYVRRYLPELAPRQVRRLPDRLQTLHKAWSEAAPADSTNEEE